jgi:hypothetical protein
MMLKEAGHRFRILALMSEGTPGALPEAWRSYGNLDEARIGARAALQDARVLRVAILEDCNPLRFVEWSDKARTTDALTRSLT